MSLHPSRGFTLVEMITAMVLLAILGAVSAVFLQAPLQMYFDAGRRANVGDAADRFLRRFERDLHAAAPAAAIAVAAPGPLVGSSLALPAVAYACNANAAPPFGQVTRNGQLLADGVAACQFRHQAADGRRIVAVFIQFAQFDSAANVTERYSFMTQVHVP